MTTLNFKDELTENAFSYSNGFSYSDLQSFGLYFQQDSKNYPYILRGSISDKIDLQYSANTYQLRNRLLNTKKIKEVIDSARVPIRAMIKRTIYYIGKGFLAVRNSTDMELLFIACIDGTKEILSMEDVNFFVSKKVYEDTHKALQPAIKDLVGGHVGDVTVCNNIMDYIGERLTMPRGGSIASRKRYQDALIRTTIMQALQLETTTTAPLVVDTQRGFVAIYNGPDMHELTSADSISPW